MRHERKYPQRIRFEYKEEDHLKLNYAHGVWGGISPRGEIELNFYAESDKIPPYTECVIGQDGGLGPELSSEEEHVRTIVRVISNKVILNRQTSYALKEWLEDVLADFESITNQTDVDSDTEIEQ